MFDSLPKSVQDDCLTILQQLHKKDVQDEIQSENIIKFYVNTRLVDMINEYVDLVTSSEFSMDEFIASDDKAEFIKNILYEAGEVDELSYDFYFQYKGKEEMIFLLELGRPDFLEEVEDEDDEDEIERKYLYLCNLMLTQMFDTIIYEKIADKLLL